MLKRLQEIRKARRLTCEQMAKILGITKATYSRKERGLIVITLNDAKKIADFFNESIDNIFFAV